MCCTNCIMETDVFQNKIVQDDEICASGRTANASAFIMRFCFNNCDRDKLIFLKKYAIIKNYAEVEL